jgi:DnaK suppressor protein
MTDTVARTADLRNLLKNRRREMQHDVRGRIRDNRAAADRPSDGRDSIDQTDADIQGTLHMALLQMRTETVTRIDEALVRLDAGKYGACFECEGEISERRLQALPFAVRCQPCEERREQARESLNRAARRLGETG